MQHRVKEGHARKSSTVRAASVSVVLRGTGAKQGSTSSLLSWGKSCYSKLLIIYEAIFTMQGL